MKSKQKLSDLDENIINKKGNPILRRILTLLFFTIFMLLGFSAVWAMATWPKLKLEEMLFELTQPLEGAENMIWQYVYKAVLPTVACFFIALISYRPLIKKVRFNLFIILFSVLFMVISVTTLWIKVDATDYIINKTSDSTFIEEEYVDPSSTDMTFPEEKRNLIYIYLESMETTYSDTENGGGFENDVIPELTGLSEDYDNFSGSDDTLDGGYVLPYTTWTMGGMFAQTSGLPLITGIGSNDMSSQETFFPGITTLGDILNDEGYNQMFMCGSDATFGGRKLYFTEHGDYQIFDYYTDKNEGLIDLDYKVWWGFEDEKLFTYAKEQCTELASSDQPFNLTILTADTHFEDGYVCELCGDEFGEIGRASCRERV